MNKFELSITELLEVDKVTMDDELSSFDSWDSLTILSIIAFCSEEYKVVLTSKEIEESITIGKLKGLVQSKMT